MTGSDTSVPSPLVVVVVEVTPLHQGSRGLHRHPLLWLHSYPALPEVPLPHSQGPLTSGSPVSWLVWMPSLKHDPLEKGMVTHSSIPAWEIPWIEEPGGL